METKNKIRFYNVDFLRFLLAIQVVIHHQTCKWGGLKEFTTLIPSKFNLWLIAVEFFFIIAGFFMFKNIKKETDTLEFAKKRFLRLAPLVWFLLIVYIILSLFINGINFSLDGNILTIFLMHSIGLNPGKVLGGTINGPIWFVSVLFWSSLFYFYINKVIEKKYLNLIVWIIVAFSYGTVLHLSNFQMHNVITKNVFYFCNTGLLRGLAGLGVGYFLAMLYNSGFLQKCSKKVKNFISVLETLLIVFFAYYFLFCPKVPGKTTMTYIVCFSILFYLFLVKQGWVSKFLNNKYLAELGKYSYSIYIIHSAVLCTVLHTIFEQYPKFVQAHLALCFWAELLLVIFVGIIVYHYVEKPLNKYFNNKFLNS